MPPHLPSTPHPPKSHHLDPIKSTIPNTVIVIINVDGTTSLEAPVHRAPPSFSHKADSMRFVRLRLGEFFC